MPAAHLVTAADDANYRLTQLQNDPACAPFLASITPIAEVQEGIEKEATSKRDAKKLAVAEFAKVDRAQ